MLGIYRFYVDLGDGSSLTGLFIESALNIDNAYGYDVEIAADFYSFDVTLSATTLFLVTEDPIAIEQVQKYSLSTGINPIEALKKQEADYAFLYNSNMNCNGGIHQSVELELKVHVKELTQHAASLIPTPKDNAYFMTCRINVPADVIVKEVEVRSFRLIDIETEHIFED